MKWGRFSGGQFRSGVAFGLVAYSLVGAGSALLRRSRGASACRRDEILAHRITWSLPVMAALTLLAGRRRDVLRVLQSRKLLLVLSSSAMLLAVNWLLYIYATVTHRVTEASLGYYMMPLVNAAFATLFLKEKLRPAHYAAPALVAMGVAIPCIAVGYSALDSGGAADHVRLLRPDRQVAARRKPDRADGGIDSAAPGARRFPDLPHGVTAIRTT